MNRYCRIGTALATCAFFLSALTASAGDRPGDFQAEFHQTYALSPDGRVELDNIDGDVSISTWDRNEVKVEAVKYAGSRERLEEAHIEIDSRPDRLSIQTKYPGHDHTFNWGSRDNPAGVQYTLTVPRRARLDEIKLINGQLQIDGAHGEVRASCVNGRLQAHDLVGRADLSTVNGHLEAKFDPLPGSSIKLSSVNGSVEMTIPSDARAEVEASTVFGGIENNFGLHVSGHSFMVHNLRGELGTGGAHIRISNVNARIEIRHASDGRPLSPAKDLGSGDKDEDDDSEI
jgi:hypothetical protein